MPVPGMELRTAPRRPDRPVLSCNDYRPNEAVAALLALCFPRARSIADVSFGHGGFWSGYRPPIRSDRRALPGVNLVSDFRALPMGSGAVDVVVYDPPFQPRSERQTSGKMVDRYTSGEARTMTQLRELVVAGALEARRVARLGLVVKCQDFINARQPAWMTFWLYDALGEPFEGMVCRSNNKMLSPLWNRQKSVWRNHASYFAWKTSGGTWLAVTA